MRRTNRKPYPTTTTRRMRRTRCLRWRGGARTWRKRPGARTRARTPWRRSRRFWTRAERKRARCGRSSSVGSARPARFKEKGPRTGASKKEERGGEREGASEDGGGSEEEEEEDEEEIAELSLVPPAPPAMWAKLTTRSGITEGRAAAATAAAEALETTRSMLLRFDASIPKSDTSSSDVLASASATPARGDSRRRRAWRAMVTRATTPLQLAMATCLLEQALRRECFKPEWLPWSSPAPALRAAAAEDAVAAAAAVLLRAKTLRRAVRWPALRAPPRAAARAAAAVAAGGDDDARGAQRAPCCRRRGGCGRGGDRGVRRGGWRGRRDPGFGVQRVSDAKRGARRRRVG